MNRTIARVSMIGVLFLVLAIPAQAQHGRPGMMARSDSVTAGRMGMMNGMMPMMQGMHRQMMQNPLHRSSMMAFLLPALADTLALSEAQTDQLTTLREELMTQHRQHRSEMRTQRQDLMDLFEGDDEPSPEAVRRHLTTMAELRAAQRSDTYETAQRMRQVLTDEQHEALAGLSPQQRMRQMMAHMTVLEMMQMRRALHGEMRAGAHRMQRRPMVQRHMMHHRGGPRNGSMHQNQQKE